MPSPRASTPPTLRRPQQERGQRRVDAILDAAATLVAEVGVAGVTVQALAERARTSKGSLYHFFPDLASVLRAVADRHVVALRQMVEEIRLDRRIDWQALTPEEVVDHILDPFERYSTRHPDLPLILRAPAITESAAAVRSDVLASVIALVGSVLKARHPAVAPKTRARRATAIVTVIDGMWATLRRLEEPTRSAVRDEMRRVLSAYLRSF